RARLAELAAELVRLKVEVIVTPGAATSAARRATKTVPVVFSHSGDLYSTACPLKLHGSSSDGSDGSSGGSVGSTDRIVRSSCFNLSRSSPKAPSISFSGSSIACVSTVAWSLIRRKVGITTPPSKGMGIFCAYALVVTFSGHFRRSSDKHPSARARKPSVRCQPGSRARTPRSGACVASTRGADEGRRKDWGGRCSVDTNSGSGDLLQASGATQGGGSENRGSHDWRLDQTEWARWVVLSGSSHATQRAAWEALKKALKLKSRGATLFRRRDRY